MWRGLRKGLNVVDIFGRGTLTLIEVTLRPSQTPLRNPCCGVIPTFRQLPVRLHTGTVNAVFPYGGVRAPLYNPLRLRGLSSLAAAPLRIIRRRRGPPQPPTTRRLSRGKTRTKPVLST